MNAIPDEFEAVLSAIRAQDDPLRRFIAALEPSGTIPPQYHRLLERSASVAFRIAPEGEWIRPHSQFEVAVGLGRQAWAEVTLPDHLASLESAARFAARTDRDNVFHLHRLRHVMAVVLDLLLSARIGLMRAVRERHGFLPDRIGLPVSYEDFCGDPGVATLSRPLGLDNLLLPDPFYFDSNAYERHRLAVLTEVRPWSARSDVAVWRGSTTGRPFTLDSLGDNERIALAQTCAGRPDLFDVKITGVVQTAEPEAVRARLDAQGLLGAWTPMDDHVGHRFAVHIDGNSSAAGFFEKLCLGCCVLRVESAYEQWFEPRIEAWTHYVPIRAEPSDILDKALFLRRNPDLAERIARAGFAFAMEADFAGEAGVFARELARTFVPARHRCRLTAPGEGFGVGQREDEGWHGLEREPDGAGFRWTNGQAVTWPLDLPPDAQGLLEVEIPFVSGIVPGFVAGCRIGAGGDEHPLRVADGCLRAEIPFVPPHPSWLVLRTPAPTVPALAWSSHDTRPLGLAIRTG